MKHEDLIDIIGVAMGAILGATIVMGFLGLMGCRTQRSRVTVAVSADSTHIERASVTAGAAHSAIDLRELMEAMADSARMTLRADSVLTEGGDQIYGLELTAGVYAPRVDVGSHAVIDMAATDTLAESSTSDTTGREAVKSQESRETAVIAEPPKTTAVIILLMLMVIAAAWMLRHKS